MRELTVVRLTDLATGRAEEFFSLGGARGAWRSASERRASKTGNEKKNYFVKVSIRKKAVINYAYFRLLR